MYKYKPADILMADGFTKTEAAHYLSCGTVIYDSPEEYVKTIKDENPETLEELMEIAGFESPQDYIDFLEKNDGHPGHDLQVVNYNDHDYLVMYAY